MKNLRTLVVLLGTVALVASAGAQNPAYSSKAEAKQERPTNPVSAFLASIPEIAPYETSSKPWLYARPVVEKQQVAARKNALNELTVNNYNSKRAVLGQSAVEFELAPLK